MTIKPLNRVTVTLFLKNYCNFIFGKLKNQIDFILGNLKENRFKAEFGNLYDLSKQINVWLLLPIAVYLGYELTLMWFEFYRASLIFF